MQQHGWCHTEWSKSDRERQISYDIAYMWNLKKGCKWTYLQNRNRLADKENKFMVTKEERGRGGITRYLYSIYKIDKQKGPTV